MQQKYKLFTLFSLYIAQALPMSFFSAAIPVIMREESVSLISIGMLQLMKLPWIAKFLWSPAVDLSCSRLSHYKRWIFCSEIIYALLILVVSLFNTSSSLFSIVIILIFAFIASATGDIATDALAIRSFSQKDKPLANAMQSMGSFAGAMLGSGVLLIALKHYGWHKTIPFMAIFVLVAALPLLRYKNRDIESQQTATKKPKWRDMVGFVAKKENRIHIGYLLLGYAPIMGIMAMLKPWLVDLGYNIDQIGFMSGIIGTAAAFLSSFLAGILSKRVSRYKSRVVMSVIMILTTLYFVYVGYTTPDDIKVYGAIVALWVSYGAAMVVVYSCAMDRVREGFEGTDFTIQTVVTHISAMILAIIAGHISEFLGYEGLFIAELILGVVVLLYSIFFRDKHINVLSNTTKVVAEEIL